MLKTATGAELLFWSFAVFGTFLFLLRSAWMAVGGLGADHADQAPADAAHADAHHDSHPGTDPSFKLITVHSLTGFAMMFGWIGLAAYKQFKLGAVISYGAAGAAGLGTMYVTALLFKAALSLTSRGTPFSVEDLVGQDATVYLRIPADGRGQVQVSFAGSTRTVDAVSDDGILIESFKVVRISRAMDGRTVGVRIKE